MAEIIKAEKDGYAKAARLLSTGQLVALPTDTVYGLAGLAGDKTVHTEIYAVKNRPVHKALSVIVCAPTHAKKLVQVSPLAQSLMDEFWPGALTLVLPTLQGGSTLAVRCPDIGWTHGFLELGFTEPLVLPSANISGNPAPINAGQVQAELGEKIPLILDGGTSKAGQASTIIKIEGKRARVLRHGAISPEQFAKFDMDLT